jgi:hypothetical protein
VTDHVLVWDVETVPDLAAMARVYGRPKISATEARELLAGQFPKLPTHQVVCIGALIASNSDVGWSVETLGAPHTGERTESDLISSFVERIGALIPSLVDQNPCAHWRNPMDMILQG